MIVLRVVLLMSKTELVNKGWDIVQKLAVVGVIALATFCFKVNAKVDRITDNKEAISDLNAKVDLKGGVYHRRISDNEDKLKGLDREVGEVRVAIEFMKKEHP